MSNIMLGGPDPGDVSESDDLVIECAVCGEDLTVLAFVKYESDGEGDVDKVLVPCHIDEQDLNVVAQLEDDGPFIHVTCVCEICQEAPRLAGGDGRCVACFAGERVSEHVDGDSMSGDKDEIVAELRRMIAALQSTLATVVGAPEEFEYSEAEIALLGAEAEWIGPSLDRAAIARACRAAALGGTK